MLGKGYHDLQCGMHLDYQLSKFYQGKERGKQSSEMTIVPSLLRLR